MRHNLSLVGRAFALRPVTLEDCAFIIDLRTDPQLSRYIHTTSSDLPAQEAWLEQYFKREGDYYFIVENLTTGEPEGTISIYDINPNLRMAEWGRWVLRTGSLAAVESVYLLYNIAFAQLDLAGLYSRTIAENEKVVSFHNSCGLETAAFLPDHFTINGISYGTVEQRITREGWPKIEAKMAPLVSKTALLAERRTKP